MGKKFKITWAPSALQDLEETHQYISKDSPERAKKWAQKMIHSVKKLQNFPQLGRKIPELSDQSLREMIVDNYRIFYEIQPEKLSIFRVLHGRRFFE